jgi:hypothetical protein
MFLSINVFYRNFLTFLGTAVVNGQHSDIWEFGKGALTSEKLPNVCQLRWASVQVEEEFLEGAKLP